MKFLKVLAAMMGVASAVAGMAYIKYLTDSIGDGPLSKPHQPTHGKPHPYDGPTEPIYDGMWIRS